jgi:hypothetical protein
VYYEADYLDRMLSDVLTGTIDVGFAQSGLLEQFHPDALPRLAFLNLQPNATYQGDPYPFLTSTPVLPTYGLAAAPSIPRVLRGQLFAALSRLTPDHPVAAAAGIATFTVPASYEEVRQTALALGVMSRGAAGNSSYSCLRPFAPAGELRLCPAGSVWSAAAASGCAAQGRPCPPGAQCLCRPCSADRPVTMRMMPPAGYAPRARERGGNLGKHVDTHGGYEQIVKCWPGGRPGSWETMGQGEVCHAGKSPRLAGKRTWKGIERQEERRRDSFVGRSTLMEEDRSSDRG